jgi:hypothetical protein
MVKNLLLIYTDSQEPITHLLLDNQQALGLKALCAKELLEEECQIFDTFNPEKTEINWFSPKFGNITNSEDILVINRVTHVPIDWFTDFQLSDREYARNEFWAYLAFALNAFPQISEKPGPAGLNSGCYPLTEQWKRVNFLSQGSLSTPDFFIGPAELAPKEWNQMAICTQPYSFYDWKEVPYESKEADSLFCMKKPNGFPILASVVGENVAFCYKEETPDVCIAELEAKLRQISLAISSHFQFFVSEVLFFYEKNKITFGMIYNIPISTCYMPDFDSRVLSFIQSMERENELVCSSD